MKTKPILLWPGSLPDVEVRLGRPADGFLVVDTNSLYDLQKLYRITRATPIFDPFPNRGAHYREFSDHIATSERCSHIVGLKACHAVLQAQNDPSLSRASIEEILAATTARRSRRHMKIPVDWEHLNWLNTLLATTLVFAAVLIASALGFDSILTMAGVSALVFSALYVCIRIDLGNLLTAKHGRRAAAAQVWPSAHGRGR